MYYFTKRLMDIIISIIFIIISSPLMIITAIVIKLESEGPLLAHMPPRAGKDGAPFRMYKFRSMIKDAQLLLETDPKFAKLYEEWKKNDFKGGANDPRVTKFGKFIRKYSIDELPQVLNVIRGEMSFVGPRAYFLDQLKDGLFNYPSCRESIDLVLTVKPGITGMWQVSGRSSLGFEQRIKLDAEYAKRKSIWLDLVIILKTPIAVLLAKGAY